jgi:hypothetical protein
MRRLGFALAPFFVVAIPSERPLTQGSKTDSPVLAIYAVGGRKDPRRQTIAILFASGRLETSRDRVFGGPPFQTLKLDPRSFERDMRGIRARVNRIDRANKRHQLIHTPYHEVIVSGGNLDQSIVLESCHEFVELYDSIATDSGAEPCRAEDRMARLSITTKPYQEFRVAWQRIRDVVNYLSTTEVE